MQPQASTLHTAMWVRITQHILLEGNQIINPVLLHNLRRRVCGSYLWHISRRTRRHVRMLCYALNIFFCVCDISNLAMNSFSFPQHVFFVSSYCLKRNLLNVFSLISKVSSRTYVPHPESFFEVPDTLCGNSI
jgi:hypothetical protein